MSTVQMRILSWSFTALAVAGLVAAVVMSAAAGESGLVLWVGVGVVPFLALAAYLMWHRPDRADRPPAAGDGRTACDGVPGGPRGDREG
jgi:fatty acid desaturase